MGYRRSYLPIRGIFGACGADGGGLPSVPRMGDLPRPKLFSYKASANVLKAVPIANARSPAWLSDIPYFIRSSSARI